MNSKLSFALVGGSALALLLAAATPAEAGRIANRQIRQQNRIAQGVASGELNAREKARLEHREAGLTRSVRRMGADGTLTPGEHVRIEKHQDRISRGIYRQKHDGQ